MAPVVGWCERIIADGAITNRYGSISCRFASKEGFQGDGRIRGLFEVCVFTARYICGNHRWGEKGNIDCAIRIPLYGLSTDRKDWRVTVRDFLYGEGAWGLHRWVNLCSFGPYDSVAMGGGGGGAAAGRRRHFKGDWKFRNRRGKKF